MEADIYKLLYPGHTIAASLCLQFVYVSDMTHQKFTALLDRMSVVLHAKKKINSLVKKFNLILHSSNQVLSDDLYSIFVVSEYSKEKKMLIQVFQFVFVLFS